MRSLGQVLNAARTRKGWGYNRVSVELGIIDGKILGATQVKRVMDDEFQNLPRKWLARLIDILDCTEEEADEAWESAERPPPGVGAEHWRLLREIETGDEERAVRAVKRHLSVKRGSQVRPVQALDTTTTQGERTSSRTCVIAGQRPRILRVFPASALKAA